MSNEIISGKLYKELEAEHVEIFNDSFLNHHITVNLHSTGRYKNGNTLRILVVSKQFNNLPLIDRHRIVNEVLKDDLSSYINPLELKPLTPEEWKSQQ